MDSNGTYTVNVCLFTSCFIDSLRLGGLHATYLLQPVLPQTVLQQTCIKYTTSDTLVTDCQSINVHGRAIRYDTIVGYL